MNINQKEFKEEKISETEERRMYASTREKLKNGLGIGLIIFGIYLLFVYFGAVPFTPRFAQVFSNLNNVLLISIFSIIVGVLLNERIRRVFK